MRERVLGSKSWQAYTVGKLRLSACRQVIYEEWTACFRVLKHRDRRHNVADQFKG